MKTRVMIIANDTTYVHNTRRETIERLIELGYEVIVVSEAAMHRDEFVQMGCQMVDVITPRQGTNPLNDAKLFFQYLKTLKKYKPDMVLSFNIKPNRYLCNQDTADKHIAYQFHKKAVHRTMQNMFR